MIVRAEDLLRGDILAIPHRPRDCWAFCSATPDVEHFGVVDSVLHRVEPDGPLRSILGREWWAVSFTVNGDGPFTLIDNEFEIVSR